jgi:hypothetical protein
MKKIFLYLLTIFVLSAVIVFAAGPNEMHWSVRSTRIKFGYQEGDKLVEKFRDEYYLYYGTEATQESEFERSNGRLFFELLLTHRIAEGEILKGAPHDWYVSLYRSLHSTPSIRALYDEEVWSMIPYTIKDTLSALGEDSPDLLLISYDMYTHSIKVFFHPKYKDNLRFHEKKLKEVVRRFALEGSKHASIHNPNDS